MYQRMGRSLSRRDLLGLAGLVAAAMGAAGAAKALAGHTQPMMDNRGDWETYPAASMLMDFATANFQQLPHRSMDELLPGPDWQMLNSVERGAFLIPPGWSGILAWANSFGSDGIPDWQPQQLAWPFWAATAAVSPDQTALYMYVNGSVDAFLSPDDGVELARTTILGNQARGDEVCAALQTDTSGGTGSVNWVAGHLYPDGLLLSRGWAILSEVSGASLGPGTTFGFDAMLAPAENSTAMMHDVFIPILWQFLPKGGAGAPTPTPTPTPWS